MTTTAPARPRPSSLDSLTDRQRKTLDEWLVETREQYGITGVSVWQVRVSLDEEVRVGRGHNAHVTWFSDDPFLIVDGTLDPYGYGAYLVAELDLVHNGHDDECDCKHCELARDEEG